MILSILMLACLVASCFPGSGTEPKTPADQTSPEVKEKSSSPLTASIVADLPKTDGKKESEAGDKDLLNKGKEIENYKLFYHSSARTKEGLFLEMESYTLSAKGNKFRIAYLEHRKLDPGMNHGQVNYDQVYLDTEAKTAYAVCDNKGVVCKDDKEKAFKLDYEAEKEIVTPGAILNKIGSGSDVRHLKGAVYDGRKVTIVNYVNIETEYEEIYIDDFYGLPLKLVVYGYEDGQEVILRQDTFTIIDISGVQNSEIMVPENYPVI